MGLGDLIDDVGDAAESALTGAEHVAGAMADDGAHVVGSGLNAVGLHGVATAMDNTGDAVADRLGDQVAEQQLGQTTDATQLIHGDVEAINQTAAYLRDFADAFDDTAQGLGRIDISRWQGTAADAFRAQYQQHPKAWSQGHQACATAASSWADYCQAVCSAQQQAQQAITLYQHGTQATSQAQARYSQAVATFQQQANAYLVTQAMGHDPGPMPQAPAAFTDPGAADRQHAHQILTTARQHRDDVGSRAQHAIATAMAAAPTMPSFTQRMTDDVSDAVATAGVEGEHLVGGIAKGTGDMAKFVRGLDPIDPYNVTHPADYIDHLSQTAAGLVHVSLHPQDLATGLIGSGWGSDPAEALGRLIPNVLAVVGTDGVSGAAEGTEAASVAGDSVADSADAAADAANPGRATAGNPLPGDSAPTTELHQPILQPPAAPGGWGDFGPPGDPGLQPADRAAADTIDTASGGLGKAEHDLSDIHVNDSTPVSSAAPADPSARPPAHTPPAVASASPGAAAGTADSAGLSTIQRRLGGVTDAAGDPAGALAGQQIADANTGLGNVERDLDGIHVRNPDQPDYADPGYQATGPDHSAYLDDHPATPEARQWLDDVRARYPLARDVPDAELLSLDTYKTAAWQINKAMRSGDAALVNELEPEIRNIASALNKLPDFAGPVVRGIDVNTGDLRSVLSRYQPGSTVASPAFTSADKLVPSAGNVEFYIDSTQGKDISFLMDNSFGPQEVVFPPDTNFEVDSRSYNQDTKTWEIRLKDIGR